MANMRLTTIHLPRPLAAALRRESKRSGRPMAEYIREAAQRVVIKPVPENPDLSAPTRRTEGETEQWSVYMPPKLLHEARIAATLRRESLSHSIAAELAEVLKKERRLQGLRKAT